MYGTVGGDPAGQQAEGLLRGGTRRRGETVQGEAGRAGHLERLETQRQVSDDRMMESLRSAPVRLDVMGCPASSELVAAGGELADEAGDRAASIRNIATASSAALFQSGNVSSARRSRKMNRARLGAPSTRSY